MEQIIIQTDLTAVAAGPLAYAVAQDLRRLADQESRGAAGVFRFSPTSLRRAYDLGWSATMCTTGWPAIPSPRSPNRCITWSTTSPVGTAAYGSVRR